MFKKERTKDTIKENHHLYFIFLSFVSFIFVLFLIYISIKENNNIFNYKNEEYINLENEKNIVEKTFTFNTKSFDNLDIKAKSYIVYDVNNDRIIYSKNEKEILPLASLTKIPAAITMLKLASSSQDIIIKKKLIEKKQKLDIGLSENQNWQMSELLKFALVYSSNSAMDIIANTISNKNTKYDFNNEMNKYVKELGFENFIFNNASGLDYDNKIGGIGNALEYAKLFAKSYNLIPEILSYTTYSKINVENSKKKIYAIPNTNKKASSVIGLLASKTGYTISAGGNLATLFDIGLNQKIVIVVLGSTYDGRFEDVEKLYNATRKSLVNK